MEIKYENLRVILPYEILQIENLSLKEEINKHHILEIKALIDEEDSEKYLYDDMENKQIRLLISDKLIYVGKIIGFKISNINNLTYLNLKAISYSYDMDIKRNKHAFVNLASKYKNIIHTVLSKYGHYDFIDNVTEEKYIQNLIVQYDETDFEFLKRIASHFKSVLVVDSTSDFIRFNFGIKPMSINCILQKEFNEVKVDFDLFNNMKSLSKEDLFENDYIEWKVKWNEYFPLGTQFFYCGSKICIYNLKLDLIRGEIIYTYYLKPLKGIRTQYNINSKLKGVSLEGIIKNEKNNQMQIHFGINDNYEESENNIWFDYCREVSDFYVMPTVGSKVRINFFSGDEKSANIINSVRSAESNARYYSKISNAQNKSYSTEYGQEILMSPDSIQIAEDDGKSIQITLGQGGNVSISGSNISLKADGKVDIGTKAPFNPKKNTKPKNINISAKNTVTVTRSSDSSVNVNESIQLKEENHIKGSKVKLE